MKRNYLELHIEIYLTQRQRDKEIDTPLNEKLGQTGRMGKSLVEFICHPDREAELKTYRAELSVTDLCKGIELIIGFLKEKDLFDKSMIKFMKKDYNLLKPHWEKPVS